jgi:hypothetical protein
MAKKVKDNTKTTKSKGIPEDIKAQAEAIVNEFNAKVLRNPDYFYNTRYKGNHLYLDRSDGPVCRLTFTGDITGWDFAIYKYSAGRYDPDEWLFPGSQHLDGSIPGALKAGLEAYP